MIKKLYLLVVFSGFTFNCFGQVTYSLTVTDTISKKIQVEISFSSPIGDSLQLIMPRYIPGDYAAENYHHYIGVVIAITPQEDTLQMEQDDFGGPRWFLPQKQMMIKQIIYSVDLQKMELEQPDMGTSSFIRNDFAGILNYSVFGWIGGIENQPVVFEIKTLGTWPVFSTINPKENMPVGAETINCKNYYELADGQTMMGPAMKIKQYKGLRPVFVADYSQTQQEFIDNYGNRAIASLELLNNYFGTVPFEHYTVVNWALTPAKTAEGQPLATEHLCSATFIGDTSFLLLKKDTGDVRRHIFGIFHHMGHAYIPLRCYGDNYKPYVTETPLLIKNIWFNEGFVWFICMNTLKQRRLENLLKQGVYEEAPPIKQLSLTALSELASLQYGDDFRIGVATFSRGAIMANEMNDYIINQTGGKKSMKDVFRYLLAWSAKNNRAFTLTEFPKLVNESVGVDVSSVYDKWQKPLQ